MAGVTGSQRRSAPEPRVGPLASHLLQRVGGEAGASADQQHKDERHQDARVPCPHSLLLVDLVVAGHDRAGLREDGAAQKGL